VPPNGGKNSHVAQRLTFAAVQLLQHYPKAVQREKDMLSANLHVYDGLAAALKCERGRQSQMA